MPRSYRKEAGRIPLGYWGQTPVYVATLLVVAHALCFIASALLAGFGLDAVFGVLSFRSSAALGGFEFWRFFTYAVVKPDVLSFFGAIVFVFEMMLLYQFGRELESFFGRRVFTLLYLALWVSAPIALAVAGLVVGPLSLADSWPIHFALFVGFATLCPNALVFFGLPARWIALLFLVLVGLISFASHRWGTAIAYVAAAATAHLSIRALGGGAPLRPFFLLSGWRTRFARRRRTRRIRPVPASCAPPARAEAPEFPLDEDGLDAVLDKISREGISSLTRDERAILEHARSCLLRRGKEKS